MTLTGMFPLGQTITVVTRTVSGQDAYGDDQYTETTTGIDGCAAWPREASVGSTSQENTTARDTVITGRWVLFPVGTNVKSIDRAVIDGLSYEVDGDPATYHSPFTGSNPGVLVSMRKVTG